MAANGWNGNQWKWLETTEMADIARMSGRSWKLMKIAGNSWNYWKLLDMIGYS